MTLDRRSVTPPFRMTERRFQQQVITLAKLYGYWCYHTHDSRRSEAGFPDLVLIRAESAGRTGRVIFAELKSQRNGLTDAQRRCLLRLEAAGAEAYCWRPSDVERIERTLR